MMFSLAQARKNAKPKITKPVAIIRKQEDGYIAYSHFYDLPNREVLFRAVDPKIERTTLKIFSIDNLEICVAKCVLEGDCSLICVIPNRYFLLNQRQKHGEHVTEQLLQLCPKTLVTLVAQPWEGLKRIWSAAGVMDNERFCIINNPSPFDETEPYRISVYSFVEDKYVKSASITLSARHLGGGYMNDLQTLGKNFFCCRIQNCFGADVKFSMLIFEINPVTNEVIERIIQPKAQFYEQYFSVVLPNGNILLYHPLGNIQIWNAKTPACIKEWNWTDITLRRMKSAWLSIIKPFPDCVHLLVQEGHDLFVLNMEILAIKKIGTKHKACYRDHHVLPNGKVIEFIEPFYNSNKHDNIMYFDLKEMANYRNYRKILTESQHLVRLFFNRNYIPTEIIDNQIFPYAYSPDAKQALAIKVANEENEENDKSSCRVM